MPPFHRLQAVRALCGSGTQLQTQALLHEKIQCLKQLGLKGKSVPSRKLLFYVPLPLSRYCLTHFSFLLFLICLLRCLSCESTPSSQLVPDSAKHKQIEGSVRVGGLRSVSPNLTDSACSVGSITNSVHRGDFQSNVRWLGGDEDLHPCVSELVVLSWESVDCPHWQGTNCCSNRVHDMGENEA